MDYTIVNFVMRICFVMGIAFGLHLFVLDFLDKPLFENKIILSYALNTIFAMIVFAALYLLRKRFKNKIGFLFILGSFFKLGFFYLLILKPFRADGEISKPEFAAFFIPYFLALIIEILSLAKWMNQMDELPS